VNVPSIFRNFEVFKLKIDYADISNLIILLLLLLLSLISLRKEATCTLDRTQTDQLKGLAILLVIVSHLWVHISDNSVPVFGDYGVSIFLFFSGFGLATSLGKGEFEWRRFAWRRIRRVMIPYWVMTAIWLTADCFLLDKVYSVKDIASTLAGINFSLHLRQIDYARWYITLLLVWYSAFAISRTFMSQSRTIWALFGIACILVVMRYLSLWPFGTPLQMLAFPLGVLLTSHRERVSNLLSVRQMFLIILFSSIAVILAGSSCLWLLKQTAPPELIRYALSDFVGVGFCVLCILFIAAIGTRNYVSTFLRSWGKISYEAFLIQGALLVKYNPVMGFSTSSTVSFYFMAFLGIVWMLSCLAHLLFMQIQDRLPVTNAQ
jgi:probable poly-beta-1,6-N-acetyl-D-glucosamine export protein